MEKYKKYYLSVITIVLVFFLGAQFGHSGFEAGSEGRLFSFVEKARDNGPKEVNWQLLWETIEQINRKYVDRPADMQKVLYGAVSGAVASLGDPYSVFLAPSDAEEFQNELEGNLEGIGAEIAIKNQQLVVVTPLDDSPAIKAGLRGGDFIFKIDGQESAGLTLQEAVKKIRGPADTKVTLTVFHLGDTKPTELTITRAKIVVKSVQSEIREYKGRKIGYLKLRRFGEDTQGQIEKMLSDFLLKNVSGIVLDVRNNPGGYLDTAVAVAGNWVKPGESVVIQKFGDNSEQVFKAQGSARLSGIPTIVLINGGSASASEILAGALADNGLAKTIGEKSFGKGSVQELIPLRDKAQVKITIAKWLTPKGHDLNKEGLEPDIKVEQTEDDFQNNRDPQLDRAIDELLK